MGAEVAWPTAGRALPAVLGIDLERLSAVIARDVLPEKRTAQAVHALNEALRR